MEQADKIWRSELISSTCLSVVVVCSVILLYVWDMLSPPQASAWPGVSWGSISGWLLCVVSATRSRADSTCLVRPIIVQHHESGQQHFALCMSVYVFICLCIPVCLHMCSFCVHVYQKQNDRLLYVCVCLTVSWRHTGMDLLSLIKIGEMGW